MEPFGQIVQRAVERLYEDERLRSNLTDVEAKVTLDWAAGWIKEQVRSALNDASAQQIAQDETTRVRQTVGAINAFAAKPGAVRLSDAVAALDATLSGGKTFARKEVFALLTTLTSAAWRMRAKPVQGDEELWARDE